MTEKAMLHHLIQRRQPPPQPKHGPTNRHDREGHDTVAHPHHLLGCQDLLCGRHRLLCGLLLHPDLVRQSSAHPCLGLLERQGGIHLNFEKGRLAAPRWLVVCVGDQQLRDPRGGAKGCSGRDLTSSTPSRSVATQQWMPTEMVTAAIDACLWDHLLAKPNLFTDKNFNPSVASFQRQCSASSTGTSTSLWGYKHDWQRRRRSHG